MTAQLVTHCQIREAAPSRCIAIFLRGVILRRRGPGEPRNANAMHLTWRDAQKHSSTIQRYWRNTVDVAFARCSKTARREHASALCSCGGRRHLLCCLARYDHHCVVVRDEHCAVRPVAAGYGFPCCRPRRPVRAPYCSGPRPYSLPSLEIVMYCPPGRPPWSGFILIVTSSPGLKVAAVIPRLSMF